MDAQRDRLGWLEGFERHESRDPIVFHVWLRRECVSFRLTSILGLRHWPFGVRTVSCSVSLCRLRSTGILGFSGSCALHVCMDGSMWQPLRPSCLDRHLRFLKGRFQHHHSGAHEEVGEFAVVENTGHFDDDRLGRLTGFGRHESRHCQDSENRFRLPHWSRCDRVHVCAELIIHWSVTLRYSDGLWHPQLFGAITFGPIS